MVYNQPFSRADELEQCAFGRSAPGWSVELFIRVIENRDVVGSERFKARSVKLLSNANFEFAGLRENLAQVRSSFPPWVFILARDDENLNLARSGRGLSTQCQR